VSEHSKAKNQKFVSPFCQLIYLAMENKSIVWIKYSGGKTPGEVRPIQPQQWINHNVSFIAQCLRSSKEKRYMVYKIVDARLHSWIEE
jgi:hypothetical protein